MIVVLVCCVSVSQAQPDLQCGTHYEEDPKFKSTAEYQRRTDAYVQRVQGTLGKTQTGNLARIVIPTVIHVIHEGLPDSISAAQVRSIFALLHDQLRQRPGTLFSGGRGLDSRVDFELATKDPSGASTTGIIWVRSPLTVFDRNQPGQDRGQAVKNLSRWDTEKYCNIWIVKEIKTNIAGFAQFPNSALFGSIPADYASTDGVMVINPTVGTIGTAVFPTDATMVHELGHWMGLYHPFQSGCINNNCLTDGDWVCDTPPRSTGSPFQPLEGRLNTCNSDQPDRPDFGYEYMNYGSPINRQSLFTPGQLARLRSFMEDPTEPRRYVLWQEANQQATGVGKWGPLKAMFAATHRNPHVGSPVTFRDYTRNIPTSWSWTFEGNPTVNLTNPEAPVVTWSTPGTYDVTLSVTNNQGTHDTTFANYITVTDQLTSLPISETFSSSDFLTAGWRIDNLDTAKLDPALGSAGTPFTFQRNGVAGAVSQGGAIRILNGRYPDHGQVDYLELPAINFSNVGCAQLSFQLSYRPTRFTGTVSGTTSSNEVVTFPNFTAAIYTDTLVVEGSVDGGATWLPLRDSIRSSLAKGGLDLTTHPGGIFETTAANGESTATEAQLANYRLERYKTYSDWANASVLKLRFKNITGYGGNLFIDDVQVRAAQGCAQVTSRPGARAAQNFFLALAPNPAQGYTRLNVTANEPIAVSTEIRDLNGRVVLSLGRQLFDRGVASRSIDISSLPAGVYLVYLSAGDRFQVEKLIKQ